MESLTAFAYSWEIGEEERERCHTRIQKPYNGLVAGASAAVYSWVGCGTRDVCMTARSDDIAC